MTLEKDVAGLLEKKYDDKVISNLNWDPLDMEMFPDDDSNENAKSMWYNRVGLQIDIHEMCRKSLEGVSFDRYKLLSDDFLQLQAFKERSLLPVQFTDVVRSLYMFQGIHQDLKWKLLDLYGAYWVGPEFPEAYTITINEFRDEFPQIFSN